MRSVGAAGSACEQRGNPKATVLPSFGETRVASRAAHVTKRSRERGALCGRHAEDARPSQRSFISVLKQTHAYTRDLLFLWLPAADLSLEWVGGGGGGGKHENRIDVDEQSWRESLQKLWMTSRSYAFELRTSNAPTVEARSDSSQNFVSPEDVCRERTGGVRSIGRGAFDSLLTRIEKEIRIRTAPRARAHSRRRRREVRPCTFAASLSSSNSGSMKHAGVPLALRTRAVATHTCIRTSKNVELLSFPRASYDVHPSVFARPLRISTAPGRDVAGCR